MSVTRSQVTNLYRVMLKEASKLPAYNFRTYALRRIKFGFNKNKYLTDGSEIKIKYDDGLKNLDILKRQGILSNLYKVENNVIENTKQKASLQT